MKIVSQNRTRTAHICLRDGTYIDIPENDWPPKTHGDDRTAALRWVELTGLIVKIRTNVETVGDWK